MITLENARQIPIITALTANDSLANIEECKSAGMDYFLCKPPDMK